MEIKNLDMYCERVDASFWSEPFNAWSNLGFVLIGIWALNFYLKNEKAQKQPYAKRLLILTILMITIGVGSFLFHTFANTLTIILDLLPIFIFTSVYLYHAFRVYLKSSRMLAAGALVLCIGSMVAVQILVPNTVLNGSVLYIPPFLSLLFIGTKWFLKTRGKLSKLFLTAGFLFFMSICFRTLDAGICESFTLGTHFLWHSLNSVFLGLLLYIALVF